MEKNEDGSIDCPLFYGDEAEEWVAWFEAFGANEDLSDLEMMQFSYGFIEGEALSWYCEENSHSPFYHWEELKARLLKKFGKSEMIEADPVVKMVESKSYLDNKVEANHVEMLSQIKLNQEEPIAEPKMEETDMAKPAYHMFDEMPIRGKGKSKKKKKKRWKKLSKMVGSTNCFELNGVTDCVEMLAKRTDIIVKIYSQVLKRKLNYEAQSDKPKKTDVKMRMHTRQVFDRRLLLRFTKKKKKLVKIKSNLKQLKLSVLAQGTPISSLLTASGMFHDGDFLRNQKGLRLRSDEKQSRQSNSKELDFEITTVKIIGKGTSGVVQLVRHKWVGKLIAMKVIHMNIQEEIHKEIVQKALGSIALTLPNEIAKEGGVSERSKVILQADPSLSNVLWESAASILVIILQFSSKFYLEVPVVVLVRLLCSASENTVVGSLNTLLVLESDNGNSTESMAESGAIEALLDLLRSHQCEDRTARLLEVLLNVVKSRDSKATKTVILPLSKYLLDPQTQPQQARLLATLSLDDLFQNEALARSPDAASACRVLVNVLEEQPTEEMKVFAICALQNLVMYRRSNKRAVAEAGGVQVILGLISSSALETSVQVAMFVKLLFSNHTVQEYASSETARAITAAIEKDLWATGTVNDEFIVKPTVKEMEESQLDLFRAGTYTAILTIEGYINFLPEERLLQAVKVGHDVVHATCIDIEAVAKKYGKAKMLDAIRLSPHVLYKHAKELSGEELTTTLQIKSKISRRKTISSLEEKILTRLAEKGYVIDEVAFGTIETQSDLLKDEDEDEEVVPEGEVDQGDVHIRPIPRKPNPLLFSEVDVKLVLKEISSKLLQRQIVEGGKRSDGRALDEIRPINARCGLLPRAHGSSLFTRGETQHWQLLLLVINKWRSELATLSVLMNTRGSIFSTLSHRPFQPLTLRTR